MIIPDLTEAEVTRFQSKVPRVSDGCAEWDGERAWKTGYGLFTIYRGGRRVRILAHRLAYKLATGKDPGPLVVRHRCDNPPCCSPADLITGTQADNIGDAIERGRLDTTGLAQFRAERIAAAYGLLERGLKRCYGCKEPTPVAQFDRNRSGFGGLANLCKPCRSARALARNTA